MSNVGLGAVRDAHIDYKEKVLWVPASAMAYGQTTGSSVTLTTGFGSGAVVLTEIGTAGVGGFKWAATSNEMDYIWVPTDFDNQHRLKVRYLFSCSETSGSAVFTTKFTAVPEGTALTIGAGVFTVAGATSTISGTANGIVWSNYNTLDLRGTTASPDAQVFLQDSAVILIDSTISAVTTLTVSNITVYGMALYYTPKMTFGDGSRRPARAMLSTLGNVEIGASAVQ